MSENVPYYQQNRYKWGEIMAVPLLRTLILYFAVIAAVRLMGKRQIGELDPSELVVTFWSPTLPLCPCRISASRWPQASSRSRR